MDLLSIHKDSLKKRLKTYEIKYKRDSVRAVWLIVICDFFLNCNCTGSLTGSHSWTVTISFFLI